MNDGKPVGLVDAFIMASAPPGMELTADQLARAKQVVRENITEFIMTVGGGPEKARELLLKALDEADRSLDRGKMGTLKYLAAKAALKTAKLALKAAGLSTGAFQLAMEGAAGTINSYFDLADLLNKVNVSVDRKVFVTAGKLSAEAGVGFSTEFAGAKAGASAMAVEAGASNKITLTDINIFGKNPSINLDLSGGFGAGIEGKVGYEKGKGFGAKLGVVWGWGGSIGVGVGLEDAK